MPHAPPEDPAPTRHARLRSGTAARLAGLPVATLRVWERRYGVVAAARTESGQRVYSPHDVSRLRLLRQLTHAGHAIGSIATLELDALRALSEGMPTPAVPALAKALNAVVVGRSAAHALEAIPGCSLSAVHEDLAQAESAPACDADLLLVRLASLQPRAVERVMALGAALRARAVFVVYGFGTEASAAALREAGATVRREPLASRDLAQWVRGVREMPAKADARPAVAASPPPRRFSDEALSRMAAARSPVACECLRHMAEIVTQLAGFERYSQDCTSGNAADAALHRELSQTAGVARAMFEQSLQRVVDEHGLGLRGLRDDPAR